MVEALNRLDQTDAPVERFFVTKQIGAQSFRVHAHTSNFVQQQPSSSATSEEVGPIDYPIHTTESESDSQLD